jgi:phospholipid-binding lipoprotein MlaA
VPPDYLAQVTAPLADRQVGIDTCLYQGRAVDGVWSRIGALFIDAWFAVEHIMNQQQRRRRLKPLAAATALAALAGCATGPDKNPADPLEPLNRATYTFNDALDRAIAKPAAKGYNAVVPRPVRTMVENFFSNLGDITVMFNDFLQGRLSDGMNDLTRVAFNSTFGIFGVIDIATPAGIQRHNQDFGLTLAHYGLESGPYLVLPIFGPSTFRDAAGFGVDQYMAPVNRTRPAVRNSLWATNFVSTRARHLNATNLLEEAALDKYLFTRDAWLGHRKAQVEGEQEQKRPDYEHEGTPAPVQQDP